MVVKSCTVLQFRLPFALNWLLNQNFASAIPKFKRILVEYSASGACDIKNATAIVASLSPNFSLDSSSVKAFLCFCFENEPMKPESLQQTLIPMIRQNLISETDFSCVAQPLRTFRKFNQSRECPRHDFSFFVDFLEQLPAFQLRVQKDPAMQEALFLSLACNADFLRTKCMVQSSKLSSVCIEFFLSKFASRISNDLMLALFCTLDMEAKIRVIRSSSSSPSVSQAMISSIAPKESLHRSASLEESLVKTLQNITKRKDAKAAVEFLKKVNVETDDCTHDVITVSNECILQLQHPTLACVARSGDIYLAGIPFFCFLCNHFLNLIRFFADKIFQKLLYTLECYIPERVSTSLTPPEIEVYLFVPLFSLHSLEGRQQSYQYWFSSQLYSKIEQSTY